MPRGVKDNFLLKRNPGHQAAGRLFILTSEAHAVRMNTAGQLITARDGDAIGAPTAFDQGVDLCCLMARSLIFSAAALCF